MVLLVKKHRSLGKHNTKRNRTLGTKILRKIAFKGSVVKTKHQDVEDGDAAWEELLARPASSILLAAMAQNAIKEFNEGQTEEGGFGDE